jgi:hypothetical protein
MWVTDVSPMEIVVLLGNYLSSFARSYSFSIVAPEIDGLRVFLLRLRSNGFIGCSVC